ncbi:unnamed protein product [Owenia fusiformis]|uniref:Uncharacterized protein n=1 Tax=Owenia fusiformis TaxID=6347 RepID=A0A8S4NH29_OWEFU|nr:unnamed protein product [Owenia fusiformis]
MSYIKFPRKERLDRPLKSFKVLTNARCAATCNATPETCKSYNLRKLVGDKTFRAICELNGPSATPPSPTRTDVDYYDRDECFSNPCLNDGTCDDGFHDYTCSCVPGYEGLRCDIDIDECLSNPCLNGGTCNDRGPECGGLNIRVVHVGGSTWGRLEVYYNNTWGSVCDDEFSEIDAKVACKHLGMSYEGAAFNPSPGGGTGDIWLDDIGCVGTETSLFECTHRGWGVHNCDHGEDVGIACNTV